MLKMMLKMQHVRALEEQMPAAKQSLPGAVSRRLPTLRARGVALGTLATYGSKVGPGKTMHFDCALEGLLNGARNGGKHAQEAAAR